MLQLALAWIKGKLQRRLLPMAHIALLLTLRANLYRPCNYMRIYASHLYASSRCWPAAPCTTTRGGNPASGGQARHHLGFLRQRPICKRCAVQYYNGAWTYHPQVKLGLYSLTATRDLIEQSVRTQLLALKPNVSIRGGAIAEELMWDKSKTAVQGKPYATDINDLGDELLTEQSVRSQLLALQTQCVLVRTVPV